MSTTDHTSDPMGRDAVSPLMSDLRIAEARALAAEVASRGYRERAEKAEAERDAAQRVMNAHRCYRHRCTCTMTEQDPWCPTHPIVDHIGPGGAAVREGGE